MNIRGIDKTSLIDYPGKICAVLFCGGCNLRCGFCHNPEIVLNSTSLDLISNDEILEFLKKRKNLIDGVTLSGGEPTLSKSIISFTKKIHNLSLMIKLDTNGLNPSVLSELSRNKLIDYVAIDIKTSPSKYNRLADKKVDFALIQDSIGVLQKAGIDFELRTTCIPGFAEMDDFWEIKKYIKTVNKYFLQQFISKIPLIDESYRSLQPYTVNYLLQLKEFVSSFAEICEVRGI